MDIVTGRSKIATKYGIVAASQPLAAQAGVRILERGGHAVDAAIATNAVMGLVEPHMNGIGGDLFAIVYDARAERLYGLNSGGWSPRQLTPDLLRAHGFDGMPDTGIHTVTIPGAVAGWSALHKKFGRVPLLELLAPAIFYAEDGFPVSDVIARAWDGLSEKLAQNEQAVATYLPDGRAPRSGEIFRNESLARSLRLIAADGPPAFYAGPITEAILAASAQLGGTHEAADFQEFEPEWVDPISTTYRGWTVYELPPNTQGIAALLMLNLMEQFPLEQYGFHSAAALHVMIESKKLAYADMLRYVGDPRFHAVQTSALLSKAHAERRARSIDPHRAAGAVEPSVLDGLTNSKGHDTIYLSAIDRDGNIVSLIQSIYQGFGSGIVAEGTGFALHRPAAC